MAVYSETLADVTTSGSIATVTITEDYHKRRKIARILVVQTAGSAASYTAEASTDSAVTDKTKRVAAFTGGASATPIDFDNSGNGYVWNKNDASGVVYVKVVPDAGADNDYSVLLFFEDS